MDQSAIALDHLKHKKKADSLGLWTFECAWEVVNKVGGIYTVIRSKAEESVKDCGPQYCLIGPYDELTAKMEFEEQVPEAGGPMQKTIAAMKERGVGVKFGYWLIDGHPMVVLFDLGSVVCRLDEWKKDFFENTKIGCPWDDKESNNAILFGYVVSWFIGEFASQAGKEVPIVAQFHEWQSGIGLVLSRIRQTKVATVFTTHATLLGRYLCSDEKTDFYNKLESFDVDYEAGHRGIYHRYCMERAAVHAAHAFTTVSQITADEALHLLKRKADLILPNGLNVKKTSSALHEFQNLHAQSKDCINRFVQGHFHGNMDFNLDTTLYFFLAGRYEFRNKGADLYLESLGRLNHMLVNTTDERVRDKTVIAFVIMPAKTANFNVDSLRGQAITKRLIDEVEEMKTKIGDKIFDAVSRGKLPVTSELIDAADLVKLKRCIYSSQTLGLPPVVTHDIIDDATDPVLCYLRRIKLFNSKHDRVKVIFHPQFLKTESPLLPMEYEEFVRGCHLGVFPSYYEPWGYTPAECTLMGVPSVTSNLSGFGSFMEQIVHKPEEHGIYIVDRRFKSPEESVQQLAGFLLKFCELDRRQRVALRNHTERLSEMLSWKSLGRFYKDARTMALNKTYPEKFREISVTAAQDFPGRAKALKSPTIPRLHTISISEDDAADWNLNSTD